MDHAEARRNRRTNEYREKWFALMRNVDELMCESCGSLPCMCITKKLDIADTLMKAAKRTGVAK